MSLINDLIKQGLNEETAQAVIDNVINSNYVPKSRFDEVNNELKQQKTAVLDRDKQLETLKKSATDNKALQDQITELQKVMLIRKKPMKPKSSKLSLIMPLIML